jgi:putative ABC transport system permease protein
LIPLGALLLLRRPQRLLPAIGGIVMAVAIMLVEASMLFGVLEAQARMAGLVRADFIVMNTLRLNLQDGSPLPMIRLAQIAGLPEVERVIPLYQSEAEIRSLGRSDRAPNAARRPFRRIVVFSFSPEDDPLRIGDRAEIERAIKTPGTVMFDRDSRPVYGEVGVGSNVEFDDRRWQVGGLIEIGPDIINDGSIVMSSGNARMHDTAIMGAVRLKADADPEAARLHMLAQLPADISVLTPAELRLREIGYTLRAVPIGILFGVGMVAGLFIGAITCYQVLFSEIADNLRMYTTLRAIGFSDGFLRRTIVEQAVLSSLLGFAAGLIVALAICMYISRQSGFTVWLAPAYGAMVFIVTMATCVGAGLVAVRRVIAADPAELF